MDGLFKDLESEQKFVKFVADGYQRVPAEIRSVTWCTQEIDESRLKYAHGEYIQNIERFALYLESSNPDHYKRAGALLHALYKAEIAKFEIRPSAVEAEAGFRQEQLDTGLNRITHISVGDAKHSISFLSFWDIFYNQALAFDVAYRCCCSYEPNPTKLTFEYFHNVCRYLKASTNLTIDDCFMLFRSLMLQNT